MNLAHLQPLALDTGKFGDEGRFVTLHSGQVIFITDSSGIVPSRLRGDAKDVKRFSRAAIERHLIEHHEQMGGGVTAHEEAQLNAHTSGNPFTFHGSLPEEVKHELAGNPHLRRLFRVTQDAKEAGGADVMGAMGEDKYFQAAHRYAGSQLGAAKQTAANSPDPEVQFLNEIHSNLPGKADRGKVVPVKANELRVGEQFTIHGIHFRVAEDADGYRVLQHGVDYGQETPVDALTTIPVDAGSFKQSRHVSRFKSDAAAPFSAAEIAGVRLVRVGSGRTVRVPTRNVRVVKLASGRVVDVALALSGDVHKFSSTQIQLPSEHAAALLAMAHQIKDEDLAEDGRETDAHVTVRYGLHGSRPSEVAPALADESPVTFKIGNASLFPATKDRPSDVIKLDVEGPDLHRLNAKLATLPHTQTYPSYHPHVTVAYVKPGMGAKYLPKMNAMRGAVVAARKVRFSSRNGNVTDIPLGEPLALSAYDATAAATEARERFIRETPNLSAKTREEIDHGHGQYMGSCGHRDHGCRCGGGGTYRMTIPCSACRSKQGLALSGLFDKGGTTGAQGHLFSGDKEDGVWRTLPNGQHVFIRGGTITKGPHALEGKTIAEVKSGGEKPVDTSRQLGIFAKDAKGNPVEVGEKPGQTTMFGTAKPAQKAAEPAAATGVDARIAKQYDPTATPELPGLTPGVKAAVEQAKAKASEPAPREKAAETTAKMMQTDYAFARPSTVANAGQDLADSARHKRNAWRGLADAEANGTAEQLVTRDKLLENEPHNLATAVEKNPQTALAMHYAMRSLPAKPGYRGGGGNEKDRRQFHETYQAYKAEAERLAQSEPNPLNAIDSLRNWTSNRIQQLRGAKSNDSIGHATASDRYNSTANALVGTTNDLRRGGGKTSVSGKLRDFTAAATAKYGAEHAGKVAPHIQDIMGGKSLPESFGTSKESAANANRFNPAERYIGTPSRVGGRDLSAVASDPNTATQHMVNAFGMRGVQWGNSVTDDERTHHAKHVVEALTDLADVTGLHPQDISLGGKLGLAIGARGKSGASAHYEPGNKVINLTRSSGVGALSHEWGHALDHELGGGGIVRQEAKAAGEYQSNKTSPQRFVKAGPGETAGYGGYKVDAAGKMVAEDLSKDPVWAAVEGVRQAQKSSGFTARARNEARTLVNTGGMSREKAANYWLANHEMFARSFETHVQHKLEAAGRKNTYLSGLSVGGGLWPTKEESAHMAPAFDKLLAAYRQKKYGSSDPIAFSSRTDLRRHVAMALGLASDLFTSEEGHWVTLKNGHHVWLVHKQGELFSDNRIRSAPTPVAGEGTSGNAFSRRDSSGMGVAGVDAAIERLTRDKNKGGLVPKQIHEGFATTLDTAKGTIRVTTDKIRDGHYAHEVIANAKGTANAKVMHKSRSTDASLDDAQRKHAALTRQYHERLVQRGDAVSVHGDTFAQMPRGITLPANPPPEMPAQRSIYDQIERGAPVEDAFDRAIRESEERDRRWRAREAAGATTNPALQSDNPAAEPDMTIERLHAHERNQRLGKDAARAAEASLNRRLAKRTKRRGEGSGLSMSGEALALSSRPMVAKCPHCGSFNLERKPNVVGGRSLDHCRDCGKASTHSPGSLTAMQCAPSDYDKDGNHKDQELPW